MPHRVRNPQTITFNPLVMDSVTEFKQCSACGSAVTELGAEQHEQFHRLIQPAIAQATAESRRRQQEGQSYA